MSRVKPIDEESEDAVERRATMFRVAAMHAQAMASPAVEADLNLARKVEGTVKDVIAKTDLASPNDKMRSEVTKEAPPGSNDVANAAKTAGVITQTPVRSHFDLSGQFSNRKADIAKEVAALRKNTSPDMPKNYLLLVMHLHEAMENVVSDFTDRLEERSKKDLADLKVLREEKAKAIEEFAKESETREAWATLQTLGLYLTYAASLVIGTSLLNSGVAGPAGYLLIAAGGLGLGSAIARDTGVWDSIAAHFDKSQETQEHIAQALEFATALIPLGLGAIGASMAYPTQASTTFGVISVVLSTTTRFGESLSNRKYTHLLAKLEELEREMMLVRESEKTDMNHLKETVNKAKTFASTLREMISASELS